jgi:hypothetical protein
MRIVLTLASILVFLFSYSQDQNVQKIEKWKYSYSDTVLDSSISSLKSIGVLLIRYEHPLKKEEYTDSLGKGWGCSSNGLFLRFIVFNLSDSISITSFLKTEDPTSDCKKDISILKPSLYKFQAGKYIFILKNPCGCISCSGKFNYCDGVINSIFTGLPNNANNIEEILEALPIKRSKYPYHGE